MVEVNGEVRTLYDVVCRIYDANMMLRAIAELDPFQRNQHEYISIQHGNRFRCSYCGFECAHEIDMISHIRDQHHAD